MNGNSTLHRVQGPAARVAHALNEKLDEIAAGVSVLRGQADTPPLQTEAGGEEDRDNREAETKNVAAKSGAEASPPAVSEIPATPSRPAVTSEARAALGSPSAPAREPVTLPPVADVRPELAAFTAAMTRQQQATVQALRQTTECCQRQHLLMEHFRMELERLDGRLSHLIQRP